MKKIAANVLTFLFLLIGGSLYAQQSWQWGQRVGIATKDIAIDGHGNTYVLWDMLNGYTIDGHSLTGYGETDIALTSFSCDGSYRWTKLMGGNSYDGSVSVSTDTLGGVYVLGNLALNQITAMNIGTGTVSDTSFQADNKSLFIVKFDTSGNFKWVRMPEPDNLTSTLAGGYSMDVTPNGNIFVVCLLRQGSYANGSYTATYPEGNDFYSLKFDRNGNYLHGVHFDMYYMGNSLVYTKFKRDPSTKGYYVGGYIGAFAPGQDTLIFGSTVISLAGYVVSFDSTGSFKWIQTSNNDPQIVEPATDQQGNIYVAGSTQNKDTLAGWSFDGGIHGYPFLVKLDHSDGHAIWGANASTNAADNGFAVSVTNGVAALTGSVNGEMDWGNNFHLYQPPGQNQGYNVFLARFNAATGTVLSLDTLGSSMQADDYPAVLSSDKQGNFYVGGTFKNALYVGPDTIYNQSSNTDGFIAKFGSANCNCTLPAAHYTHNGLQSGGTISFNYDGSTPVDSVVWDFGDGESGSGSSVTHNYPQDGSYTVCATAYNSCGSNMYCEELAVGDVGITEIPGFADISVYPNPATQMLTVSGASAGTRLGIYDALGRLMQQTVLKGGKDQIDVSQLSAGIYIMRFTDKNGRRGNVKFVKE